MAQFSRHATIDWKGTLMEGGGEAKAGSGAFSLPTTFPRRISEDAEKGATSPEELVAAAHATCYAMVIAATMGKKGATVARHTVTCTIIADKSDAGIKITTSKLDLVAEGVSGMDAATFTATAKEAEKGCPVSNALRGSLAIDVNVTVK
jgi:osmotically inducible protein OsmC